MFKPSSGWIEEILILRTEGRGGKYFDINAAIHAEHGHSVPCRWGAEFCNWSYAPWEVSAVLSTQGLYGQTNYTVHIFNHHTLLATIPKKPQIITRALLNADWSRNSLKRVEYIYHAQSPSYLTTFITSKSDLSLKHSPCVPEETVKFTEHIQIVAQPHTYLDLIIP